MRTAVITRTVPPEVPYTGRIVIADNFQRGAGVWSSHDPYPATQLWWQGIYVLSAMRSLRITENSAVAGATGMGIRRAPALSSGTLSVEISFLFPNFADVSHLIFLFKNVSAPHWGPYYPATYVVGSHTLKQVGFRYVVSDISPQARWQYYNSSAGWTDIDGGVQELDPAQWHKFIAKFDVGPPQFGTPRYIEFNCDGMERDISTLDGYSESPSVENSHFEVQIGVVTRADDYKGNIYIDDVLVVEGNI